MGWCKSKVVLVVLSAFCTAAPLCFGQNERGEYRRSGDTIWAERLEAALERGDNVYLDRCYILSHVDFPDTVFGDIDVSNTTFELGMSAVGSKFHGGVYFFGDTMDGIFLLQSCHLASRPEGLHITAKGTSLFTAEGVVFMNCVFRCYTSFIGTEIAGPCYFRKLHFDSCVTFDNTVFMDSVRFVEAHFHHSVDFRGTEFSSGGIFRRCTFTNGRIEMNDLRKVRFRNGVFDDVVFETANPPSAKDVATMSGLTTLKYTKDPTGLQSVRQDFKTNGFRGQERQLTFALKRRENEINRENGDWVTYYLNLVLFDWTCDYGMSYLRPLRYALYVWLAGFVLFASFALSRRRGDIVVCTPHWDRSRAPTETPIHNYLNQENIQHLKGWRLLVKRFLRLVKTLLGLAFFALMSAFNIGFRDFNFGRWLRLLLTKEIDIKAVGWARTVSGLQALLSVLLFALFILSYFGRPFE